MIEKFDERIKNKLSQFVGQIAMDEAACRSSFLLPPNLLKTKAIAEFDNHLEGVRSILTQGVKIIQNEILLLSVEERDHALQAFYEIKKYVRELNINDSSFISQPIISYEWIDPIYGIGRQLLLSNDLKRAEAIFSILLTLRPNLETVWLAFAITEQQLKNLEIAEFAYNQVLLLNPSHIYSKQMVEKCRSA